MTFSNQFFDESSSFYFLIPAAGSGARMGSEIPKQYLCINSKPVVHHVLDVFLSIPVFSKGVIVLSEDDHYWQNNPFLHDKLTAVIGGSTRHQSVLNGCLELKKKTSQCEGNNPWVLVHDAARPGISISLICKMCQQLEKDPVGGILALPVVDTVKQVDASGRITQTLNRELIYLAQTPQMFRLNDLILALEYCKDNHIHVTDEASAIEAIGLSPKIVLGDHNNFKITYPCDLEKMTNLLTQSST